MAGDRPPIVSGPVELDPATSTPDPVTAERRTMDRATLADLVTLGGAPARRRLMAMPHADVCELVLTSLALFLYLSDWDACVAARSLRAFEESGGVT